MRLALLAALASRGRAALQDISIGVGGQTAEPSSWECVADPGADTPIAARGTYDNQILTGSGWGILHVSTADAAASGYSEEQSAFAAGCVEAYLTHREIYHFWYNYLRNEYRPTLAPPAKLLAFMEKQERWTRDNVEAARREPASGAAEATGDLEARFWRGMGLLMAQFDGLVAGVAAFAPPEERALLSHTSLYLLEAIGDLENLNGLMHDSPPPPPPPLARQGGPALPGQDPHYLDCSALISLLPKAGAAAWEPGAPAFDIAAGHTTWRGYYAMLRIYKVYELGYTGQKVVSIASSPALLHSKDDVSAATLG